MTRKRHIRDIGEKVINSLANFGQMKYVRIIILAFLVIFSACNKSRKEISPGSNEFTITVSGTIENGNDQLVSIDRMGANAFIPIDSGRCDDKGKFGISFQNDQTDFYALKYSSNGYITLIARPGDSIEISGATESLHPYSVKGSPDSELIHQLSIAHKDVLRKLQLISDETNDILGDEKYSELKQELNRKFDSIADSFRAYSEGFIKDNSSSLAILIALYNQFGPRLPVFQMPLNSNLFQFVDSSLYSLYPDNEAVKFLHSQLITVTQQIQALQKKPSLSIGMEAPDFVMKTNENKLLSLKDLRGQFVLIQFWASWSKLSMDENIFLLDAAKNFRNSSFTILQVSVDNDRESWIKTIKNQKLDWHHVSDLNRWESAVVDLYEVERIPANFLIDPKGIIVEKDIFGEDLERSISKYITRSDNK